MATTNVTYPVYIRTLPNQPCGAIRWGDPLWEKRKQTKVSFVCIVSRLCFQALGNTPDTGLVYKLIR